MNYTPEQILHAYEVCREMEQEFLKAYPEERASASIEADHCFFYLRSNTDYRTIFSRIVYFEEIDNIRNIWADFLSENERKKADRIAELKAELAKLEA